LSPPLFFIWEYRRVLSDAKIGMIMRAERFGVGIQVDANTVLLEGDRQIECADLLEFAAIDRLSRQKRSADETATS
jgi:hypothetical protein